MRKDFLKKVYPTKEDLYKLINNTERDIMNSEQFDTMESKQRAKRLKDLLKNVKKEWKMRKY